MSQVRKSAIFKYAGVSVEIGKFDPSNPNVELNTSWLRLQQEVYDQLDDSGKFTKQQLRELYTMDVKKFLSCITSKPNNPLGIEVFDNKMIAYLADRASGTSNSTDVGTEVLDALLLGQEAQELRTAFRAPGTVVQRTSDSRYGHATNSHGLHQVVVSVRDPHTARKLEDFLNKLNSPRDLNALMKFYEENGNG